MVGWFASCFTATGHLLQDGFYTATGQFSAFASSYTATGQFLQERIYKASNV